MCAPLTAMRGLCREIGEKRVCVCICPLMWGGARTSYHDLALDFELGIVARILEEEVDVADHGERFDIFVCELELARDRLQWTCEDDECKF